MSVSDTIPQVANSGGLLLDSLEIKNFRAFRHLTIEKLGRVNLITGKNNVGKSSVLEALLLFSTRAHPAAVRQVLRNRDEYKDRNNNRRVVGRQQSLFDEVEDESDIGDGIAFLFHGKPDLSEPTQAVEIGSVGWNESLKFEIRWFVSTADPSTEGVAGIRLREALGPQDTEFGPSNPYFVVTSAGSSGSSGFRMQLDRVMQSRNSQFQLDPAARCRYVPAGAMDPGLVSSLWDQVALTSDEDRVVECMRLISDDIFAVNLIGGPYDYSPRLPVVKTIGPRVPLRSFGDGINRLFAIALALVTARDGILLLDEVENGLHYSVQQDIWRFIFQTARRLNVQVFATTHSWDCIEAFQRAAAEDDDPSSGVLIRLQNKNGNIVSTVFDEEDLAVITREGIEVR